MASLLGMLGLNLPGFKGDNTSGSPNPFAGLVGGGMPTPPTEMGQGLNALIPTLVQALTGQFGQPLETSIGQPQITAPFPGSDNQKQLTSMAPGTTAPAYDPSGLPPLDPKNPMAPVKTSTHTMPDGTQMSGATHGATSRPISAQPAPLNWPAIRAGIFKGESGGDPNALFGFSNRPGQRFANTKLTDMTVDEAIQFSSPKGPYGQWVKNKIGRVATPMGTYQIVGTTLREVKQGMGLKGSERMTPELQEEMGKYIYKTQGTGAWEGYRGPADPASMPVVASSSGPAYGPTSNEMTRPSGSQSAIPSIAGTAEGGYRAPKGEFNTALKDPKDPKKNRKGGGGASGPGDPGLPGGGGSQQNQLSPDYKRFQARKNIRHLRGLSPVATIQALENIGKGLRTQGGGRTS